MIDDLSVSLGTTIKVIDLTSCRATVGALQIEVKCGGTVTGENRGITSIWKEKYKFKIE